MQFVVISGLAGSGKSTLGRELAKALQIPLIDKDSILEHLFNLKGAGDTAWRRALSRESDTILPRDAESSSGAVLVSFWHVPGMPEDSGTPAEWLLTYAVVHLRCVCPPEIAARRFHQRPRHPGHLDAASSYEQVLAGLQDLARLEPLSLEPRIDVDTSQPYSVDDLVSRIRAARNRSGSASRP